MSHVTRVSLRLTAAALLLGATAAFAGIKPTAEVTPLGDNSLTNFRIGTLSAQATCTLGITGAASSIVNYLLPPNDAYYTLVDPGQCSACPQGVVTPTTAHLAINWRGLCTQQISVGIYGAVATGDGCYVPDPNAVICPPTLYNVSVPAAGNYNISFNLPAGCCFQGPAFLKIEFVNLAAGCSTSTTIPRLITTNTCLPCTSWNIYPGGGPDDLCVDIGFPGNPIMNLDVDCCSATPTQKHSWGTLKSHYR